MAIVILVTALTSVMMLLAVRSGEAMQPTTAAFLSTTLGKATVSTTQPAHTTTRLETKKMRLVEEPRKAVQNNRYGNFNQAERVLTPRISPAAFSGPEAFRALIGRCFKHTEAKSVKPRRCVKLYSSILPPRLSSACVANVVHRISYLVFSLTMA